MRARPRSGVDVGREALAGEGAKGIVDGPTEVHKLTIARQVLTDYHAAPDIWPSEFKPRKLVNARRKFDELLDRRVPDAAT